MRVTVQTRDVLDLSDTICQFPQTSSEFLPDLTGSVTLYIVQNEACTILCQVKVAWVGIPRTQCVF
jgi:hypothetical protein